MNVDLILPIRPLDNLGAVTENPAEPTNFLAANEEGAETEQGEHRPRLASALAAICGHERDQARSQKAEPSERLPDIVFGDQFGIAYRPLIKCEYGINNRQETD